MQWPASEGNRQSKKYYIDCYLRSTYAIEAGSEVRTDLGPRHRRGRRKIRTKFNLRPPNGCGQHAPNRGIFLPNICADIPGAWYGLFISFQELELANVDMLLLSLRFLCAARHIRMFVHL